MIPVLIHLCINMLIAPPSCPVWGAVSPGIPHAGCSSAPEMKASRRCPVVSAQHPAHCTGDCCCSMSSLWGLFTQEPDIDASVMTISASNACTGYNAGTMGSRFSWPVGNIKLPIDFMYIFPKPLISSLTRPLAFMQTSNSWKYNG